MAHHARKTYLNIHVRKNLEELDGEGAVIIVDYKMKILPQSARETKTEFFGKRVVYMCPARARRTRTRRQELS